MGEARRKQLLAIAPVIPDIIYHHTSSLKLHSICEDGFLKVESAEPYIIDHPQNR
jgi:hypothetical protein